MFVDYEESRLAHPNCFPPTLVVLDINMPRMDGFEFLAAYDKLRPKLQAQGARPSIVLMVTSSTDPRDKERADKLAFVKGFIRKPPTVADAIDIANRFGQEEA
jgi:CheY-like chemotaxis protein